MINNVFINVFDRLQVPVEKKNLSYNCCSSAWKTEVALFAIISFHCCCWSPKARARVPTYLQCLVIPVVKHKGSSDQEAVNTSWKSPSSQLGGGGALRGGHPQARTHPHRQPHRRTQSSALRQQGEEAAAVLPAPFSHVFSLHLVLHGRPWVINWCESRVSHN